MFHCEVKIDNTRIVQAANCIASLIQDSVCYRSFVVSQMSGLALSLLVSEQSVKQGIDDKLAACIDCCFSGGALAVFRWCAVKGFFKVPVKGGFASKASTKVNLGNRLLRFPK